MPGFTSAALSICRSAMRTNRGTARCRSPFRPLAALGLQRTLGQTSSLHHAAHASQCRPKLERQMSIKVKTTPCHVFHCRRIRDGGEHRSDRSPWPSARSGFYATVEQAGPDGRRFVRRDTAMPSFRRSARTGSCGADHRIVYEQGQHVGYAELVEGSIGFTVGGQSYSELESKAVARTDTSGPAGGGSIDPPRYP